MSKDSSAKYHQNKKERLQKKKKKKTREKSKSLPNEEKDKKSNNMIVKNRKVYRKIKDKSLSSIDKNYEMGKNTLL